MAKLAFVTTVYNGETFLGQAIESMTTQAEGDIEICVVLDGSTDGSEKVARSAAERDPRIRVVSMPRIGRSGALNVGIAETSAPVVAILDADDLAAPWRVARTLEIFEDAPSDVGLVGGRMYNIRNHEEVEQWEYPGQGQLRRANSLLRRGNPLAHSSVAIRRSVLEKVGGYSPRRIRQVDYDLYVRLASRGVSLLRTDEILGAIREHEQRSFQGRNRSSYLAGSLSVQSRAIRFVPGPGGDVLFLPLRALGWGVPARYRTWFNPALR